MKLIGCCIECKFLLGLRDINIFPAKAKEEEKDLPECGNRDVEWLFCRVLPKDFGCIYWEERV